MHSSSPLTLAGAFVVYVVDANILSAVVNAPYIVVSAAVVVAFVVAIGSGQCFRNRRC